MKLFVFDVDGTLINNFKPLKKSTINTLNKILERGDVVCIASGRPLVGINRFLNRLIDGKKYAICANGAAVCSTNGETLYENTIPYSCLLDIKKRYQDQLNKMSDVYCYIKHEVGYFKKSFWVKKERKINKMEILDLKGLNLKSDDQIYKIMIAMPPQISKKLVIDDDILSNYHVVRSADCFVEILNKTCDKADGVRVLAEILNIKKDDIYCFGDNDNDYLMIKNYNGVAMGNATKEVKEVAKFVTKSVQEDGVTYAIEELLK